MGACPGVAVAGAGIAVVRSRSSQPPPVPPPQATATPSPRPSPRADTDEVLVTRLGRPLLRGQALDVYGLADSAVVRIELATGRLTRSPLPAPGDVGISFVPVREGIFVHIDDWRPGYLVRDGGTVLEMPPTLDGAGPMLPGPDLDHVWVQSGDGTRMTLMTTDGKPTGTSVAVAAYTDPPVPDGAGWPLYGAVGGFYRGVPGRLQRITTGVVIAPGPPGWLVVECDERDRCTASLVRRDGSRRAVPGVTSPRWPIGRLAPDARTAAVYIEDSTHVPALALLDLGTGRRQPIDVALGDNAWAGVVAWSADSRWMFTVDATASIVAVDSRTSSAQRVVPSTIVPAMPFIRQIAVRPSPAVRS
jgi:hypothetical protein